MSQLSFLEVLDAKKPFLGKNVSQQWPQRGDQTNFHFLPDLVLGS